MSTQHTPQVLNKYHDKRSHDAIYIGRPSKWGNPFKIGEFHNGKRMTREDVIAAYNDWLMYSDEGQKIVIDAKKELKGKDLVCYCKPLACHGDTLIRIANEP